MTQVFRDDSQWLRRSLERAKNRLCKWQVAFITAIPISLILTGVIRLIRPDPITFEIQINDLLVSSSSNAAKLNTLLGSTRQDPSLIYYLASPRFISLFFREDASSLSKSEDTRLSRYLRARSQQGYSLSPRLRISFAKGERYEDLQVIKVTLLSNNPEKDITLAKSLADFFKRRSEDFRKTRIDKAKQIIRVNETQGERELGDLRQKIQSMISRFGAPPDGIAELYQDQLTAYKKQDLELINKLVTLNSQLASTLGVKPEIAKSLVSQLGGITDDRVQPLVKSLQEVNVKIAKMRSITSKSNQELSNAVLLRYRLLSQLNRTVPGWKRLSEKSPDPSLLPDIVSNVIEVKSIEIQRSEASKLQAQLLKRLNAVNSALADYALMKSSLDSKTKALDQITQENEQLLIELNRMAGNWELIKGPYADRLNIIATFMVIYVLTFSIATAALYRKQIIHQVTAQSNKTDEL